MQGAGHRDMKLKYCFRSGTQCKPRNLVLVPATGSSLPTLASAAFSLGKAREGPGCTATAALERTSPIWMGAGRGYVT